MRFYTGSHAHYCGIDLHAKTMYLCILDREGRVLLHENLRSRPEPFLAAVAPYRGDFVVAVECIFTWYWLADLCAREGIPFVLGHALYMKAIHGGKAKNDRIDAYKIAHLLRGGNLPRAYVYPPAMRATRDLLRRRLHLVRRRANLLAHVESTHHQYNLDVPAKKVAHAANREGVAEGFAHPDVRKSVETDLALVAGERILGNCRIRPELIPEIELDGGHVSYDVRPSERGRGYGTELLRLALDECRRLGLARVLLTTALDNERSMRVIRANGGVELDRPLSPFDGQRQIRWQISL